MLGLGGKEGAHVNWPGAFMRVGSLLVVAGALYLITMALIRDDKDFDIVLDDGIKITARGGDALGVVIDEALAESPGAVRGILEDRGYVKVHSSSFINAIALTVPSELQGPERTQYLRLAARFQGPFAVPDIFREMDEQLFEELYNFELQVRESRQPSPLIGEMLRMSLDREGIFRPRMIKAEVEIIAYGEDRPEDSAPLFYTCAGNMLGRRTVAIGAGLSESGQIVPIKEQLQGVVISDDPVPGELLGCNGSAGPTTAELAADQPLKLGVDHDTFSRMFDVASGSDVSQMALVELK